MAAIRLITLPPGVTGEAALAFADAARRAGAEAIEVRSDLHASSDVDAPAVGSILPLLAAERGAPVPQDWLQAARWVDLPLGSPKSAVGSLILSHHAQQPMASADALALWRSAKLTTGTAIKHVEPLGDPLSASRLLETQRRLREAFPNRPVTVLATGPLALPFRSLLAEQNALDYLSHSTSFTAWAAAEGQRRLEDAVRAARRSVGDPRKGILGSGIAHSRSPRIHRQPFDRIDLPSDLGFPETNPLLSDLLSALLPHYDGFAVTTPFKKSVAEIIGSPLPAVNTLVRSDRRTWLGFNTDVTGARAALRRLGPGEVQVLGDGGATAALRAEGRKLVVLRREAVHAEPLSGLALWTWPAHLMPPKNLSFRDCRVGVIAYGEPGRRIAAMVRERGGSPVSLGPAWFIAQAREQRRLWEAQ